ncbi:cell differentiation protein rcd1 [Zychaea mexicana]|uniref:cell differentiation protein rcd1 n=1 Tax=Zychaea mexicana TaxID=64656 RepID=UPI0022FF1030|nr:cell differentiation protein rcd1 [Zychaea mexicana]KAI9493104.1 cell differentiation protein rcd1 [Zychaea mexicana]
MHPNSQYHQYLQQPSLSGGATPNPLAAVLQSAGTGTAGVNALSQQYSALGAPVSAGGDPFAAYSVLMNSNPAAAAAAAAQNAMTSGNSTMNFPFLQQDHQVQQKLAQLDEEKIYTLVLELLNPSLREQALLDLSKKREQYEDLALVLWYSYGVMSVLLQEIVSVYPMLTPPTLNGVTSNRVCNALALLQCVANHNETRTLFLHAHIPLYLYPFLNTTSKTRPFEYLRLTSLGVIGALVKNDNPEVISFLLSTEIIPLCLRIMETGSELSKTVAIFIVQKILLDETGLYYICQTYERFYAVATVLHTMVNQLVETQAIRLLKHVIRCYLRLSDNPRAREALRQCLPEPLRDTTFHAVLKDDGATRRCLGQLLINLSDGPMN